MLLLPAAPLADLGLAIVLVGTAWVLFTRWSKTFSLAAVILVMFGLQTVQALFIPGPTTVTNQLVLVPRTFLQGDQWWAPLTYLYLHAGFIHIFGNLFVLVTVGPLLEERVSQRTYLLIYFGAGLAAAVATIGLAMVGFVSPTIGNLGASGAIFGVLGAFAMLFPREKIPVPIYIIVWLPALLALAIYILFVIILPLLSTGSGVAWYGHLAGLIVGFTAYVVLARRGVGEGFEHRASAASTAPVDVASLRALATSERASRYLDRLAAIEGSTPDDATWAHAWLERFAGEIRCPTCGERVQLQEDALVCETGDWSLDVPHRAS